MKFDYDIEKALEGGNFAEEMSEEDLNKLGSKLKEQIQRDDQSRKGWLTANEEWTKLALQTLEAKCTPWQNSSNVKYPLLTVASVQFHARAQQALLKGPNPVKAKIVGYDDQGTKKDRAERVGKYMSYQILHQFDNWEDDMDRLLMLLPFMGLAFKKTYNSRSINNIKSELVLAQHMIINYYATDFDKCRKTHEIPMDANDVHEMMKLDFYLDIELSPPRHPEKLQENSLHRTSYTFEGDDIPRMIWESHCWVDMDGDGYKEPWIVTLDKDSGKVLRVSHRFEGDIRRNAGGEITRIDGHNMFTRYFFMPDPHSSIYGMGLGNLLGPLNSAVNTLINQLVDAGTLAVLPSGFLGRGVRNSKGGTMRFQPGEWKGIQSTGDDLRKSIFPLPAKEPSNVLFQLLGLLIDSGKQVGSIADIMLGENPGQNQPYSTTVQVLEQGMKVFVGIYKRIYRSLASEYKKIYDLNRDLPGEVYMNILDREALSTADFEDQSMDIVPSSDPDMINESQKLLKAESLFQKMAQGMPVNPTVATQRILEAEEHSNIPELMQMPPPQPDFELQFKQKVHDDEMALELMRFGLEKDTTMAEIMKDMAQAKVNLAKAKAVGDNTEITRAKVDLESSRDAANTYLARRQQDVDERKEKAKRTNGVGTTA